MGIPGPALAQINLNSVGSILKSQRSTQVIFILIWYLSSYYTYKGRAKARQSNTGRS